VSRCSLKQSEAIDIEFSGVTGVDVAKITIAPGGGTGLHCHYGDVIGVIEEGDVDVVLYVMYVTPDGKPLAEKDLSKCDKLND